MTAKNPKVPDKLLFPPSTEAFCYIMLDNNVDKWTANVEMYLKNTWRTHLPAKKMKSKGEAREPDPHHDAKYTDKDGGQQQFGTFSKEGMEQFEKMRKAITLNRRQFGHDYNTLEKEFLASHLKCPRKGKESGKKRKSAGDGRENPRERVKIINLDESDDEWMENAPSSTRASPPKRGMPREGDGSSSQSPGYDTAKEGQDDGQAANNADQDDNSDDDSDDEEDIYNAPAPRKNAARAKKN